MGCTGVCEGDSPTFMYLVSANRGINDPEDPTQPSWGGQYERKADTNHYVDGPGGSSISKWRKDYQKEFQERADWCVDGCGNGKAARPKAAPKTSRGSGFTATTCHQCPRRRRLQAPDHQHHRPRRRSRRRAIHGAPVGLRQRVRYRRPDRLDRLLEEIQSNTAMLDKIVDAYGEVRRQSQRACRGVSLTRIPEVHLRHGPEGLRDGRRRHRQGQPGLGADHRRGGQGRPASGLGRRLGRR